MVYGELFILKSSLSPEFQGLGEVAVTRKWTHAKHMQAYAYPFRTEFGRHNEPPVMATRWRPEANGA
jgi:hypothetical protein